MQRPEPQRRTLNPAIIVAGIAYLLLALFGFDVRPAFAGQAHGAIEFIHLKGAEPVVAALDGEHAALRFDAAKQHDPRDFSVPSLTSANDRSGSDVADGQAWSVFLPLVGTNLPPQPVPAFYSREAVGPAFQRWYRTVVLHI